MSFTTADRDRESNTPQEPSLNFERLEQNLRDNLRESASSPRLNNPSSNESTWTSENPFNPEQENPEGQDSSYEFAIDSFNFQELSVPLRPTAEPVLVTERVGIIDLEDDQEEDDDEEEVHQTVRFFRFPESTQTDEATSENLNPPPTEDPPPPPPPPEEQPPQPPEPPQEPLTQSTTAQSTDVPMGETSGPSTSNNEEIPEGVDPSFLEALPPDMRSEVLEQHRILRLQQRISALESVGGASTTTVAGSTEVSPEFLAALPPSLQEEVLTQQRLEQQRQAAARANPNEPVDAGAFFETLQPSLRTMVIFCFCF